MIDKEELREIIREELDNLFCSEEIYCPFGRMRDNIQKLVDMYEADEKVELAVSTLDKFEDYMKNIDRFNAMINEFKGLVSIVRSEAKNVQVRHEKERGQIVKLLKVLVGEE